MTAEGVRVYVCVCARVVIDGSHRNNDTLNTYWWSTDAKPIPYLDAGGTLVGMADDTFLPLIIIM